MISLLGRALLWLGVQGVQLLDSFLDWLDDLARRRLGP